MAKKTINNGESGLNVRTKLNDMMTELYELCDALGLTVQSKSDKTHSHDGYEPKDPAIQGHIQTPHAPADANNYVHPATHPYTMINGLKSAATKDAGTGAGEVLLMDEDQALPAVSGRNLQDIAVNATDKASIDANSAHRQTIIGNPHAVTKADVGLGNADNTGDANKPVSTAQQAALDAKSNIADIVDDLLSAEADAPLSANQGRVLKGLIDNINTLLASDDTTLDELQEVVDFIKANKSDLDSLGIANIAGLTDALAAKVETTTFNAHANNTANPHSVTKAQVGLGNADNTSDVNKPVSTAQQLALTAKTNITDIKNDLVSTNTDKPLAANQGRILKDSLDAVEADALLKAQIIPEADFMVQAADRRVQYAGSGAITSIEFADFYAPELTANTLQIQASEENVNGFKIYCDAMDVLLPPAPSTSALLERQDLLFREIFHEKITDKGFVYVRGNSQSEVTTDPSTGLSTVNGSFTGYDTYSLSGNWQNSGDLIGKGLVWSTLSEANKKKFVSDPKNNVYLAEDGTYMQVRYRIRVIEGLGAEWEGGTGGLNPHTYRYFSYQNTKYIRAKGALTSISNDLDSFNVTAGTYQSQYSYYFQNTTTEKQNGLYGLVSGVNEAVAYKGQCFALQIALVSRRNQGAFHYPLNTNGAANVRKSTGGAYDWFYSDLTISSTGEAFDLPYRAATGTIASGLSGHPDDKFYDAIYESDIIDLRNSAHKVSDLKRTLDRDYMRLITGEMRGRERQTWCKPQAAASTSTTTGVYFPDEYKDRIYKGMQVSVYDITSGTLVIDRQLVTEVFLSGTSGESYFRTPTTYSRVAGNQYLTVVKEGLIGGQQKTLLQCDIIGDPADYYRGQDFTNTGSSQTVTVNSGDIIWNRDGNSVNGLDGHFYKRLGVDYTGDLSTFDFSNAVAWEDLGTDWNGAASWLTNGVMGTPLLVGENGEDYIAEENLINMKASRKCKEHLLTIRSPDSGVTWQTTTTAIDATTNKFTVGGVIGYITMVFYLTEASPFETANNAEVLSLGNVFASCRGDVNDCGLWPISHMIGKIPTGAIGVRRCEVPLTEIGFDNSVLELASGDAHGYLKHSILNLTGQASPAAKALPYLTRENSKLYLQLLFKEMIYDSGLDNSAEFTIEDGTTFAAFAVGTKYLLTGLETKVAVICESPYSATIDNLTLLANGTYIKNDGTVILRTWDGNGWGDDNKFDIVDGISTTTDDNGNTGLTGQVRVELKHFIGEW